MNWLDQLERKFGRYAIPGLITYIVALNGLVYLLMYFDPTDTFLNNIALIPERVWQGEVWRLISYIFIPPFSSPLFIFFALQLYYTIGSSLEQEWGSFKFNLFYLTGMLGTTLAAFLTGGITTSLYLNLSLFLAFAQLFPDFELLLFFVLPVKVKYLGWLQWANLLLTIVANNSLTVKIAAVVSVLNFFLFFGRELFAMAKQNNRSYHRRQQFRTETAPAKAYFHRCTICGKTEQDDPKLEFRYCAQCMGDHEYCMEHLKDHEHLKA